MTAWQERYLARWYDRGAGWTDGTVEFHDMCRRAIPKAARILEIGAGGSNPTSRFLATLGELHGVDIDPDVRGNDALKSAAVVGPSDAYPFEGESFDACVSNFVLEHVEDPETHFREVRRVLKPGGTYTFRTPNRWHYVSLVAAATPHWFHVLVANRVRNLPTESHDPHPTVHAANTRSAVRRLADSAGFSVDELRMVEKEPSYGMSSRALFLAFMAYERAVNATLLGEDLRANIFATLRKR